MTKISVIAIVVFLSACGNNAKKPGKEITKSPDSVEAQMAPADTTRIIGERINGPANIRDGVNGSVLFTLNDEALVTCTEPENEWCQVGLAMVVSDGQMRRDTLKKGTIIVVDGKVVGEVIKDIQVSSYTNNKATFAELTGFTHIQNIHLYSIIEQALKFYLSTAENRSLASYKRFINQFEMEKDLFSGFEVYFTYENWIDDPSPLIRLELIFKDNMLIGVLHSRQLNLPGTKTYALERDFKVSFFDETKQDLRSIFMRRFNSFINQVD